MDNPDGVMVELSPLSEKQVQSDLEAFGNITIEFFEDEMNELRYFILNYGFLHLRFDKIK
jgi:hypothetical protein